MQLTMELDDQLMAMAAHRYCLDRGSYIVSSCWDWIRSTWDQFSSNTKVVMIRDTLEVIWKNEVISKHHKEGWKEIVQWAWYDLDEEEKDGIKTQVEYWRNEKGKDAWFPHD